MKFPQLYLLKAIIFILVVFPQIAKPEMIRALDPLQVYPEGILFDVIRNQEQVGYHQVDFSKEENGYLKVLSQLKITIKVLGINFYKYDYHSQAWWNNKHLIKLIATQNDDGAKSQVQIYSKNSILIINGPDGESRGPLSLYPSNHWHAGVLDENKVIDTLKGQISNVKISKVGVENVLAEGRLINAIKYKYNGDVDAIAWYDITGRWIKLSFPVKDGSIIEYICVKCGLGKK